MKNLLLGAFLLAIILAAGAETAAAFANTWKPFNNRFISWQEDDDVIHIFAYNDVGTPGQPMVVIRRGRPILMGFEMAEATVADLHANYLDNPDHDILLSIDGNPPNSLKAWYQPPFEAATGSGPAWSWDHDGDGPGDGDGDGIGDWNGAVMFFRAQHPGNSEPGIHTFTFSITNDGGVTFDAVETVTVLVE
jgi:hypothetical protein